MLRLSSKKCDDIFNVYKLENNKTILHVLLRIGVYLMFFFQDNKKALIYFEKTANMGSVAGISDMIRVKFFEYPDYDPTNDFEKGLQWHSKTKNQTFFLVQQASYFLFIKRDLLKSIGNMNKIIAEEKASLHITVSWQFNVV